MSDKDSVREVFENIRENTDWDMSNDMLWGHFFTNSARAPLDRVVPILEGMGFRYVDVHLAEKENDSEPDQWWLHVEREGIHTVDSLFSTNEMLKEFAEKHGLDEYDGWDVGPIERSWWSRLTKRWSGP